MISITGNGIDSVDTVPSLLLPSLIRKLSTLPQIHMMNDFKSEPVHSLNVTDVEGSDHVFTLKSVEHVMKDSKTGLVTIGLRSNKEIVCKINPYHLTRHLRTLGENVQLYPETEQKPVQKDKTPKYFLSDVKSVELMGWGSVLITFKNGDLRFKNKGKLWFESSASKYTHRQITDLDEQEQLDHIKNVWRSPSYF